MTTLTDTERERIFNHYGVSMEYVERNIESIVAARVEAATLAERERLAQILADARLAASSGTSDFTKGFYAALDMAVKVLERADS